MNYNRQYLENMIRDLRLQIVDFQSKLPEEVRADLELIEKQKQRIANLEAAIQSVLDRFERCWTDDHQHMVLRTARAIMEDRE
jgi:hypothetical protein